MTENSNHIPTHVGLILDGNRRWAKENHKTVAQGHRQGYQNLKTIAKAAINQGVQYVSAYVFSTENWNRDPKEVDDLMKLLKWVLKHEAKEIHKDNIRIRVIGSKTKLGSALLTAINDAEELTKDNTRGTLLLCLDYGGQQEIIDATKQIIENGIKSNQVTIKMLEDNIYAPDVPPVDLIIRTSGEQRLSNFMMWRSAYSELLFSQKYWPQYNETDLIEDLERYEQLQRRFGK